MIDQKIQVPISKSKIHHGSMNPEKLNEVVKIISPPILLFTFMSFCSVGGLIIWSILGSLPQTVQASAVFIPPETLIEIKAESDGNVYFYDDLRPGILRKASQYNRELSTGLKNITNNILGNRFLDFDPSLLLDFINFYGKSTKLSTSNPQDLLRVRTDRNIGKESQNASLLDSSLTYAGVPFAYIFDRVTAASLDQAANTFSLSQSSVASQIRMNIDITSASSKLVKQLIRQERELVILEKQGIVEQTQVLTAKKDLINASSQNLNTALDLKKARGRLLQNAVELNAGIVNAMEAIFIARPYDGVIIDKIVKSGNRAKAGQTIALVSYKRNLKNLNLITAFIPPVASKGLRNGMEVLVNPSNVDKNQYGSIRGTLESLSAVSIASDSAGAIVGYKSLTDDAFKKSSTMFIATIRLKTGETISGYQWNTSKGPNYIIPISTPANITIISDHIKPASLLLPFMKEMTGQN